MRFIRNLAVTILIAVGIAFTMASPARAIDCKGSIVNPITDICWSCLFPISLGGLKIFGSDLPDTDNPSLPICLCGKPIPRIGLAFGYWEPVRLIDVTQKPFCFVNLGGLSINPGLNIGMKKGEKSDRGGNTGNWEVHWYVYPLLYWLELLTDFICMDKASFDVAYITEIDPLWRDDELTFLLNAEAALFGNLIAQAACAADCAKSSTGRPFDTLFWCAGCQGGMYPLNGNIQAQYGQVQGSVLAAERLAYKLHRQLIAWGTSGGKALCGKYVQPIIKKSQYRIQMTNPVATASGKFACNPMGRSTNLWSYRKMLPVIGEDFGYLLWRKRNCCVL